MLHVTNNTMKKTALIIMALGLFALATAGCEDAYKANSTSNNNNTVVQETPCPENASCKAISDGSIVMSYDPPIVLSEVIETIPSGYGVLRATSSELDQYAYEVAFTEATSDINFILDEYKKARNEFLDMQINIEDNLYGEHLQKEGFEGYAESERVLLEDLNTIYNSTPTPELKIQSVLVGEM